MSKSVLFWYCRISRSARSPFVSQRSYIRDEEHKICIMLGDNGEESWNSTLVRYTEFNFTHFSLCRFPLLTRSHPSFFPSYRRLIGSTAYDPCRPCASNHRWITSRRGTGRPPRTTLLFEPSHLLYIKYSTVITAIHSPLVARLPLDRKVSS